MTARTYDDQQVFGSRRAAMINVVGLKTPTLPVIARTTNHTGAGGDGGSNRFVVHGTLQFVSIHARARRATDYRPPTVRHTPAMRPKNNTRAR